MHFRLVRSISCVYCSKSELPLIKVTQCNGRNATNANDGRPTRTKARAKTIELVGAALRRTQLCGRDGLI